MNAELQLSALGPTVPLARGGVGQVEALRDDASLVFKRFHDPDAVDAGVLRAFVAWRRELSAGERARLDQLAAWPQATVLDGRRLVGFVMRRVPDSFSDAVRLPSGTQRRVLREAQYLMAPAVRARRLQVPAISTRVRLEVVWSLVSALAFLHQRRMVVGDLSTRNVLWQPAPARVLLVDCDSFTLGGVGSPLPPAFTVDWEDPAQPDLAAASADVYKLGLFVVRALGRAFQTRDPALAEPALDATGRLLLRGSLASDPASRPTAGAWERWATGRRVAPPTKEQPTHV